VQADLLKSVWFIVVQVFVFHALKKNMEGFASAKKGSADV
jgi:hypothetical protein